MGYSNETINLLLDVQVSKKNSTLETDLYCKEIDKHQYMQNPVTDMFIKSVYHLSEQYC